ncbi:MAG: thymidylate kinase [Candidatus Zambryskibacteria bacterium]|nr:thymidylate kinase [Candidatus Zambryskibacteria bacterium]
MSTVSDRTEGRLMRAKFIAIDGNDGAGKETQAKLLSEALKKRGEATLLISFPRYEDTFFGQELRRALRGDYGAFGDINPYLASYPYAADRWISKPYIEVALKSGIYVISDRYMSANQIHQGGKISNVKERERFLAWLDELEYGQFKIPHPDISIYLDVPVSVSKRLMSTKTRDIVENSPKYLENSYRCAQWLIKRHADEWMSVKCMQSRRLKSREEIHEEIMEGLRDRSVL